MSGSDSSIDYSQPLDAQNYLIERLDKQQKYHSDASGKAKSYLMYFRVSEIVLAALIPVLTLLLKNCPWMAFVIALVGASVAILAGLLAFGNYQQLSVTHRNTSELLKTEKFKFLTQCDGYCDADFDQAKGDIDKQRLCKLVKKVESILSAEHSNWTKIKQQQAKKGK
ncbi:DUF4231 domain-containing protein [Algibacillus agarilyticus]|uniref:DUF4231 domain-containing protein n=1 Tax=Algibacillus agarilyticus TaxID=2234133 RepID=UPI000DD0A154|nr:DUF4231 domain-containing protein [Algibacillus agarilyticus]